MNGDNNMINPNTFRQSGRAKVNISSVLASDRRRGAEPGISVLAGRTTAEPQPFDAGFRNKYGHLMMNNNNNNNNAGNGQYHSLRSVQAAPAPASTAAASTTRRLGRRGLGLGRHSARPEPFGGGYLPQDTHALPTLELVDQQSVSTLGMGSHHTHQSESYSAFLTSNNNASSNNVNPPTTRGYNNVTNNTNSRGLKGGKLYNNNNSVRGGDGMTLLSTQQSQSQQSQSQDDSVSSFFYDHTESVDTLNRVPHLDYNKKQQQQQPQNNRRHTTTTPPPTNPEPPQQTNRRHTTATASHNRMTLEDVMANDIQNMEMELEPGVFVPFRGEAEVRKAGSRTIETQCLDCSAWLVSLPDCLHVLCPDCNMLNPIFEPVRGAFGVAVGIQRPPPKAPQGGLGAGPLLIIGSTHTGAPSMNNSSRTTNSTRTNAKPPATTTRESTTEATTATLEDVVASARDPKAGDAQAPVEMEVAPGLYVPFRDAQETWTAVSHRTTLDVACLDCGIDLVAVKDCEHVLCPDCSMINPILLFCEEDRGPRTWGVNLGLKKEWVEEKELEQLQRVRQPPPQQRIPRRQRISLTQQSTEPVAPAASSRMSLPITGTQPRPEPLTTSRRSQPAIASAPLRSLSPPPEMGVDSKFRALVKSTRGLSPPRQPSPPPPPERGAEAEEMADSSLQQQQQPHGGRRVNRRMGGMGVNTKFKSLLKSTRQLRGTAS